MSGKELGYTYDVLVTVSGDKGLLGSPSKTNFRVNLGSTLQKIARVSIASVTFPNNAYNVNETGGGANNGFAITSGLNTYQFALDGGFYTTTTLMAAIQTAINDEFTTLGDGQTIAISQDALSQKVEIKYAAGAGPATITILDSLLNSGAWELLGFTALPAVIGSLVAIAPDLPSLGGLKEVYLQSNTMAPGKLITNTDEGSQTWKQQNTLVTIPITAPFGVSNVFECKVDALCQITYISPRMIQECDFYLTDKAGNVVDLHGGNLVINLKLWFNRY